MAGIPVQAQTRPSAGAQPGAGKSASAPVELIGIVFAQRTLNLEAEIDGQIVTILAELGQRVNREQVLLKLESPRLHNELKSARASVASSQAELDKAVLERDLAVQKRDRRLQMPDAWSTEEQAEIRFSADMAEVEVALAKARLAGNQAVAGELAEQLERATVRAPFAGVISAKFCELGEHVDMGSPLLRLISDSDLGVRFGIPESLVGRIGVGSALQAQFPVLGVTVPLKVSRVAPEIDLSTGLATAEGVLLPPEATAPKIWPGMTVRVVPAAAPATATDTLPVSPR